MSFSFYGTYGLLWVFALFQGLLLLALLRELGELRRIVGVTGVPVDDHLPLGSPAPAFAGIDLRSGQQIALRLMDDARGQVVLFVSPGCSVCRGLADSLRLVTHEGFPRIVAICSGKEQECRRFVDRLGPDVPVLVDTDGAIGASYRVWGPPTAVVVEGQLVRSYGHPTNVEDLKALVSQVAAQPLPAAAVATAAVGQ